jgi:hypothetical protein
MPIEIRELIIKAIVGEEDNTKVDTGNDTSTSQTTDIDITEQVKQMIEHQNER